MIIIIIYIKIYYIIYNGVWEFEDWVWEDVDLAGGEEDL